MTTPRHIALVGCGFTGTSAFYQLVDRYPVEKITIFEATGDFGPGYPYRTDESRDYLINNTTDTMCLVASNRRAFVDWLRTRPDLAPDLDEKGHLPRPVYGEFLKDAVAATRVNAAIKGIAVDLIPHAVSDITETDGGVTLTWAGGTTVADVAILTTGRAVEYQPFPAPPAGGARYLASHIGTADFETIPPDATVHIMGASLSAYDVLNRLFAPSTGCRFARGADGALTFVPGANQRHAVLCSRSGRIKGAQTRNGGAVTRNAFTPARIRALAGAGQFDLAALRDLVMDDAAANGVTLDADGLMDPYRDCADADALNARAAEILAHAIGLADSSDTVNFLVDFLGDAQVDLWDLFAERLLSAEAERTYRDAVETAVLCYAAPCPVPTAEKILALMKAGRLRILKGARDVGLDDTGAYTIHHDFGSERADILVNTIGAVNRDVAHPDQDGLTRALAKKGYLRPYARDGIALPGADVDMASFRATGATNIYVANMMLWGPGFFTSSAFMMATVVERLLARMFQAGAMGKG
ncbi:FAD/NAD(P)-binding protein [Microbaculum marinisediminis]|uniref:FAD/NAD(P)-binding protein n=1 Tax=Microbaculum marinisediminis TaxID=2931392 RepID=A0AAW5QXK6_9HYPH|nr:FAD/NAD(P)-binding domain-containing protein [Microbaculum sp. A6E488]MCT8972791.1 FAD/NAD(P)-binding protein [Microbaculum sp. A6E488]